MNYTLTQLEEDIESLYKLLHIQYPYEIDMLSIANDLNIWIHYCDKESDIFKNPLNGLYSIFIDERLSVQEQWQDFGHELAHAIKHVGNQDEMRFMFRTLQENQANSFMYHFCIPTFMLLNLNICNYSNIEDGVPFVSKTFNVTEDFARERLQMFQRQMFQAKSDEEHRKFMESLYPKAPPYSDETNKVLKQLELLKAKKKQKVVD